MVLTCAKTGEIAAAENMKSSKVDNFKFFFIVGWFYRMKPKLNTFSFGPLFSWIRI
jgi:hypothetical protein